MPASRRGLDAFRQTVRHPGPSRPSPPAVMQVLAPVGAGRTLDVPPGTRCLPKDRRRPARTHDVALVNDSGQLLAKRHITDDAAGYKILLDLLAEYGDTEENLIPVAIETSRGLLVAVLRTGKRQVFAINPMAASATGTGTASPARSPTLVTPWSWPTFRAPTCTPTGRCRRTATWPARSPCSHAPSRTPPGTGSRSPTSCARCGGSTTPPRWPPSSPGAMVCAGRRPTNSARRLRHRREPRS